MRNRIIVASIVGFVLFFTCMYADEPKKEVTTEQQEAQVKEGSKGTSEKTEDLKTDVEKLKKLKFSGFVQAQYERHDDSKEGVDASGKPLNYDNFVVRRARLKVDYSATKKTRYIVYIDAGKDKVKLLDAYAEFKLPHDVKITFGQFKWPFGHEIPMSMSELELPERSKFINELFPGVRDRGIKASGDMKIGEKGTFEYVAGIFNGTGIEDKTFTWQDADKHKDIVGRVGADFGKIRFGFSGYSGKELVPGKPAVPGSTTWYDADGDGTIDEGEYVTKDPVAATPDVEYDKERYGVDFQWYCKVLQFGNTAFKVEYLQGKQRNKDVDGWYGLIVQDVGKRNRFALRVDSYNPDTDTCDRRIMTYTPSWIFHWDENLKFMVAYDIPKEKADYKVDNDMFTFRIQYKF